MPIITLTTDFGQKDPDLAYLKSQILQLIPDARLVDISHDILPFDPDEAIYIIKNSLKKFPERSIHIVGVESAVNSDQNPVLIRSRGQFYLGKDNGILTTALEDPNMLVYALNIEEDDSFMTVQLKTAQLLSQGVSPSELGEIMDDYKRLSLSKPLVKYDEATGEVALIAPKVIYTDHYGNAVFNLLRQDFLQWQKNRPFKIKVSHYVMDRILSSYNDALLHQDQMVTVEGHMFAHFNRFDHFEIFIYKSNRQTGGANTLLGLDKNKTVHIVFD